MIVFIFFIHAMKQNLYTNTVLVVSVRLKIIWSALGAPIFFIFIPPRQMGGRRHPIFFLPQAPKTAPPEGEEDAAEGGCLASNL